MLTGKDLNYGPGNFNIPFKAKVHFMEREFWGVNFNEFNSGMTQEKHAAARNLELGNHLGMFQENDKQGNQCQDDQ